MTAQGASIGKNRNSCILNGREEFIKQSDLEFDYYLFVDYDIAFNLEHIIMLVMAGKGIITGSYPEKTGTGASHCGTWLQPGIIGQRVAYNSTGVAKVDWCGGGFLLIHRSILEQLPYPWFRSYVIEYQDKGFVTSEDIGFCKYASDNGLEVFANLDCKVVHMKDGLL